MLEGPEEHEVGKLGQLIEFKDKHALKFFLQSSGHPLEMLMCGLDDELAALVDGVENDYALTLAQNGIALNLDGIFDQTDNQFNQMINEYKKLKNIDEKLQLLDQIEKIYEE